MQINAESRYAPLATGTAVHVALCHGGNSYGFVPGIVATAYDGRLPRLTVLAVSPTTGRTGRIRVSRSSVTLNRALRPN